MLEDKQQGRKPLYSFEINDPRKRPLLYSDSATSEILKFVLWIAMRDFVAIQGPVLVLVKRLLKCIFTLSLHLEGRWLGRERPYMTCPLAFNQSHHAGLRGSSLRMCSNTPTSPPSPTHYLKTKTLYARSFLAWENSSCLYRLGSVEGTALIAPSSTKSRSTTSSSFYSPAMKSRVCKPASKNTVLPMPRSASSTG
jgi:hypothetical protein